MPIKLVSVNEAPYNFVNITVMMGITTRNYIKSFNLRGHLKNFINKGKKKKKTKKTKRRSATPLLEPKTVENA